MNESIKLNDEILKYNEHNKFLIFMFILGGWIFLVSHTGIENLYIVMLNIAVSCFIWFKFNKFHIVNNKCLISNLSEIDNILKENEFLVQENTRLESIYQENKVLVQKNAELEKNIFKQSEELIHIKAELENMCQKNIKLDRDVKNFKTRATDNQKCILFLLYKKLSAQYKIVSRKEFFHYLNKDLQEEKCPTQLKSIHFIESLCDKNLEFEFTAKGNNNVKNDS